MTRNRWSKSPSSLARQSAAGKSSRAAERRRTHVRVESLEQRIALSSVPAIGQVQAGLSPAVVGGLATGTGPSQRLIADLANSYVNGSDINYQYDSFGNLEGTYNGQEVLIQHDPDGTPWFIDPSTGKRVYVDNEDDTAAEPQQVTGAFLTDESVIGQANGTRFSFTDVEQDQSPTCAFAATLSAVARSSFNLAGDITLYRFYGPNDFVFGVRLFAPDSNGVYQSRWVNVPFDGTIYPTDLQSTDPSEYWPTLFQRAYLTLAAETGATVADTGQAILALTGHPYTYSKISSTDSSLASAIAADLNAGEPVVAATPGQDDPAHPLIPDGSGLIQDHAYTVLGIDSGSSGTFVTLRNPWAQDTSWMYFDTNHDGTISPAEDVAMRSGLSGYNDGIFRLPWSTFTSDFSYCMAGQLTGPSLNTPLSLSPPQFRQAGLGTQTVVAGNTLSLDLSAVAPDGGSISYYLDTTDPDYGGSPGTLDLNTGSYTWAVPSNEAPGTYVVTAVAQESPVDVSSLTFEVSVVNLAPQVTSLTATEQAISADSNGEGQISLTANVANDTSVTSVAFFRDTDHNGQLDSNDEKLATLSGNGSATYSWSGALQDLTPGTSETFFFVAENDVGQGSSLKEYQGVGSVTLPVIAGASLPPLVAPVGVETLANPPGTGTEANPLVTYDGAGDSAIFWSNQTTNQVYMQRSDSSGTSIGGPVSLDIVEGTADDVAMLPDGHFVILWTSTAGDLRAREFNADGTPYPNIYDYIAVDPGPVLPGARIAMSAVGEYSAVYVHGTPGDATAYLTRFSSGFSYATVPLGNGDDVEQVAVAMDSSGATLACWGDETSGQVMAERFSADPRSPVGSPVVVNALSGDGLTSAAGASLAVAVDASGRAVFAWSAPQGTGYVLMARRFLPDLTPVDPAEFQVSDSAASIQVVPRVAFQAGRLVITWEKITFPTTPIGSVPNFHVFAQAFTWDNTLRRLGGNFEVPTTTAGDQFLPAVAIDDTGTDFSVAWLSDTGTDPDTGVYFKRFDGLNAVPQGFALQALPPQTTSLFTIPLVPEANELLGRFTDPIAGSWTYTLVAGPGDTDNGSFQIQNGFLSMTQSGVTSGLKANYSILVEATPAFGVPVDQIFNFAAAQSGPVNFGQFGPNKSQAYAVAFQSNGDYIVAGESYGLGFPGKTALRVIFQMEPSIPRSAVPAWS